MNFKLKLWPTHWAGGSAHWPINRIFLEATGDGKIPSGTLAYIEHHGCGNGKPLDQGGNEVCPTGDDMEFAKELVKRWNSPGLAVVGCTAVQFRSKLVDHIKERIQKYTSLQEAARASNDYARADGFQAAMVELRQVAAAMEISDTEIES